MAGHVYAIASGKGGVGKTTTVVNLGVVLRRADHSVALVDADLGMANLAPMVGVSGDQTLHEVLAGDATLEEALMEEAPGFAVLPGSEELRAYADADPSNLRAVLETLAASYDFVLVDTGAGMSHEDVLPLGLADRVVLVASPDPAAVGDTRKTAELADLAAGQIAGLVVTKADADTDVKGVASQLDVELLGVIPFDPTVRRSTAAGRPLEAVDPETPAAGAYRELAERLVAAAPEPSAEPPAGQEAVAESGAEGEPTAAATEPAPSSESTDEAEAGAAAGGSTEPTGDAAEAAPGEAEPAPETTDEGAQPASTGAEEPPADPVDDAGTAATGDEPDAPDVGADEATESTVEDAERAEEEGGEAEAAAESEGEEAPEEAEAAAGSEEEGAEAEAAVEAAEADDEPEAAAEEEEEEEDYLAEFEDDEPESKGGLLSRIGRLFRL